MPAFELVSSAGRLAARHDPPAGEPASSGPLAAVVCHPHPVAGGTMDNKVTFTVAKALREAGLHVVRFNFRGFGGSEGVHDEGIGERDDVRAALDHAASLVPEGSPLLVAGFSFGSWVGTTVGLEDPRVAALMAIAPPVMKYDYSDLAATDKPLAVVYARDDELVPVDAVEAWLATCANPPRITPVVGATHLFHGKLGPIREAARSFVGSLVAAAAR